MAQILVGYTVFFWVLEAVNRFVQVRLIGNRKSALGIIGDHQLMISSAGVVETTSVNENKYRWAGIPRIERTPTHMFLWVNDVSAHIIPLSAFPSGAAANEFELRAQEFKAAATLDAGAKPLLP